MSQIQTKIKFTKDKLIINDNVSVESWERSIQIKLVETIVKPTDVVIELGYGLGMASDAIQKISPREYWIVEKHYEILAQILKKELKHINFIISSWQKVLPIIQESSFDSIIYDADPNKITSFDGSAIATMEFILPVFPYIRKILKTDGRLGFIDFSGILHTYPDFLKKIEEYDLDFEKIAISVCPSPDCTYAQKGIGNIIKIIKK
ncbi:MAG: hypothetical protein WA440_06640 [Ignavibacteriaceae bacterium]